MGDLEDRLVILEQQKRRLERALRMRRRPPGRKIRPRAHTGDARIFGYARTSGDGQEESVAMQEGLIRKKAQQMGGRLARTWVDDGVSGAGVCWKERQGFTELMADLQPGDHLILWRLDRLDSSPVGAVAALEWLVDKGVWVHVLDHGGMQLDLDAEAGRLLVVILGEFTHLLLNYRREAVRQSVSWRRERGLAYNKMPELGKRRIRQVVPDLKRRGQTRLQGYDVWDEQDCAVIREIWRRHELEGETLYAIAKDLKARDERRWDGTPWLDEGCRRQAGSRRRYPFSPRTVQRAFWKYTAMLAAGKDLQDLDPHPEHVRIARARICQQRLRWTRKGQSGRLPKEVRDLLEKDDLVALAEITPRSWARRLYCGPGQ